MAGNVFSNAADAVTAVMGNAESQRPVLRFFGFAFALKPLDFGVFAFEVFVQQLQAFIKQGQFEAGEMVFQPASGCAQVIDFSQQRGVLVAVGYQRAQELQLLFGL